MKSLNIVFAGTPEFALPCLDALAASPHQIAAIYTQPDRPAGRGRQLKASPVKAWAEQHQLPIFQPLHFKEADAVQTLRSLAPDIMIVIAYGLILPLTVLQIPTLGCINVHASLLPRWRGASPIQQALLHGDKKTGVTIMQMDAGMDTGAILTQESCPIMPKDDAQDLHDRLAKLAVSPLLDTLELLASGKACAKAQDGNVATYAPKIKKEDAHIQWQQPAIEIARQIRAFNPWPIAFTYIDDETPLRIYEAEIIAENPSKAPGTVLALDKQGMAVATGQQVLLVKRLQLPGGKILSVTDYLNAAKHHLTTHMVLR